MGPHVEALVHEASLTVLLYFGMKWNGIVVNQACISPHDSLTCVRYRQYTQYILQRLR